MLMLTVDTIVFTVQMYVVPLYKSNPLDNLIIFNVIKKKITGCVLRGIGDTFNILLTTPFLI